MSGEYVYLATSTHTTLPVAAFVRKHELERWCASEEKRRGIPVNGWCRLYGVRSVTWENRTDVREFEFKDGRLVVETP